MSIFQRKNRIKIVFADVDSDAAGVFLPGMCYGGNTAGLGGVAVLGMRAGAVSRVEEFIGYIRSGVVAVETGACGVYWYPGFSGDAFLRLNDFPDEPIFTAMCAGEAVDIEEGGGIGLPRGESSARPGVPGEFSTEAPEEPDVLRLVESSAIRWRETRSPIVRWVRCQGAYIYLCGNRSLDPDRYALCSGGWARDIGRLPVHWL